MAKLPPRHITGILLLAAAVLFVAMMAWAALTTGDPDRIVRCGGTGDDRHALLLTDAQCQAIGASVPILQPDAPPPTNVTAFEANDGSIRVGAPPPAGAELSPLPRDVQTAHPALAPLRYFLVEDEIALVDPRENRIVAFVEVHTQKPLGFWDWRR